MAGIRFRFFVRGEDIRPKAVRGSREGAVIVTAASLVQGDTVLAYPYIDETNALPAVLVSSVIQTPDESEQGYRVRWLRCLGHHGVETIQELLFTYLRFSKDALPPVPVEVANSSLVAFDFVRQTYFVPRRRTDVPAASSDLPAGEGPASHTSVERRRPQFSSSTSYSGGAQTREPTGVIGYRRLSEKVTSSPKAPDAVAHSAPAQPSTTDPVHLGSKQSLPPEPEEPTRPPIRTLSEYQANREHSEDTPAGSGHLLNKERARMPVKLPVTFEVGRKKGDGTITSLGLHKVFLATEYDFGEEPGRVEVTLPISGQRTPVSIKLICAIEAVETGEELGYPGVDMTIVGVDQRQRPGIFERYIKTLYYEMTRR